MFSEEAQTKEQFLVIALNIIWEGTNPTNVPVVSRDVIRTLLDEADKRFGTTSMPE